jgi:hypothetical protein
LLSNTFTLKLGHDAKQFLVDMTTATGKDIAEHVMRPGKVIHTGLVIVGFAHS